MIWLLHLISKRILWTMLTFLNAKFLRRFWKRKLRDKVLGTWWNGSILLIMTIPEKREVKSCCNFLQSLKNLKKMPHEKSRSFGHQKFLPWWRSFWFSISWAAQHSGGWSSSARYPCATRFRSLDCRCLEKRDQKKVEETISLSETHFSMFCALAYLLRSRCNCFLLPNSEKSTMIQFYEEKMLRRLTLVLSPATLDTQINVHLATWLQICFRCKTPILFTSRVNHSWTPVF